MDGTVVPEADAGEGGDGGQLEILADVEEGDRDAGGDVLGVLETIW